MPVPPRTVFDGLEGVWDAAEREWREANRRREEIEAANVRARCEVVDAASRGVQRVASGVRASALRAGQVVDAVVGNRGFSDEPQVGPVDRALVNQRMAATTESISRNAGGALKAGPEPAGGSSGALGEWVGNVGPGGAWDGRKRLGDAYERQGNFSFWATAAALGIPKSIAQAGAGFVQRGRNMYRAALGEPLNASVGHLRWPYSDNPRDQRSIAEGYAYGLNCMRRSR